MAASAARSVFRSSSLRNAASRITSEARAARSPFRLPKQTPAAPRILRSPVEMSFCVESLLPMHSATASALMNSLLTVSRRGYGWLSEGFREPILVVLFRWFSIFLVLVSAYELAVMTYDEYPVDSSKFVYGNHYFLRR